MIEFAMFFGSRLYAGEKNGTEISITAARRLLYHGAKRNDRICHVFRFPAKAGEKNGTEISITAARRLLYHGAKRNDRICHVFRFPAKAGEKNGTETQKMCKTAGALHIFFVCSVAAVAVAAVSAAALAVFLIFVQRAGRQCCDHQHDPTHDQISNDRRHIPPLPSVFKTIRRLLPLR